MSISILLTLMLVTLCTACPRTTTLSTTTRAITTTYANLTTNSSSGIYELFQYTHQEYPLCPSYYGKCPIVKFDIQTLIQMDEFYFSVRPNDTHYEYITVKKSKKSAAKNCFH